MTAIRLLTSIHGTDSPVVGDPNDILDVPDDVAAVWADGERAELVDVSAQLPTVPRIGDGYVVDLVKHAPDAAVATAASVVVPEPQAPTKRTRQRRTRPVSA